MDGEGNGDAAALLPPVSRAVGRRTATPLRQAGVGFDLDAGSTQMFTKLRGPPKLNWIQFDSSLQKIVDVLVRPYQQREEESWEPIQIQYREGREFPPLPGMLRLVPVEEQEQDDGQD